MTSGVSPAAVEAVLAHIDGALAEKQDEVLTQACTHACDVLDRWVGSAEWNALAPPLASAREPVAGTAEDWSFVRQFLVPVAETLDAIRERSAAWAAVSGDSSAYIEQMLAAATYTSRRYPRLDRQQLFIDATSGTRALQRQVCAMAAELAGDSDRVSEHQQAGRGGEYKKAERRARAVRLLAAAGELLLTVRLTMAGASPARTRRDIPDWAHEVVNVLFVHQVARVAAPARPAGYAPDPAPLSWLNWRRARTP